MGNSIENENPPAENSKTEDKPDAGEDPLVRMLRQLQNSTDNSAKEIKAEVGGLKTTMEKNNKDMTEQIEGLKDTINTNAENFRKGIVRIDKRLDENDTKTAKMINDAIAEAIRKNNEKRDKEREARLRALETNPNYKKVEELTNRVNELEEETRKRDAAPIGKNQVEETLSEV